MMQELNLTENRNSLGSCIKMILVVTVIVLFNNAIYSGDKTPRLLC